MLPTDKIALSFELSTDNKKTRTDLSIQALFIIRTSYERQTHYVTGFHNGIMQDALFLILTVFYTL